ncbi:MAG: alkaline phosphatase family protein [Bacteroidales bacterium]|nr:alkaline phosphatase family protein [Bacteroidales bacterium]
MKKILIVLLAISFIISGCNYTQKKANKKPYLVVLSLDGFRWNYPQMYNTPVLDSLKKAGVFAEMIPSFPSKTFPNHYTLATGLYPDHHGIVMNQFYDPQLKENYSISDRKTVRDGKFYGGEPIWNTATKQGVKNAVLFWVGSEANIQGMHPEKWYPYNQKLPFTSRIDTLVQWLSLPVDQRPHLIMWYYPEPDGTGHHFGPRSEQARQMVEQLDNWLGQFFTAMRKLPEFNQLNFIITSDHGMQTLSPERNIILDKFIDTADLIRYSGGNPVYNIGVKPGKLEAVYKALKRVPHLQVWKHDSLPERLHYGHNPRTLDLTLAADPGWSLYWSWKVGTENGTHGYDNSDRKMHAIFYAAGPAFKKDFNAATFPNVDVYPLMCKILGLKPAPNDGNLSGVEDLLKK